MSLGKLVLQKMTIFYRYLRRLRRATKHIFASCLCTRAARWSSHFTLHWACDLFCSWDSEVEEGASNTGFTQRNKKWETRITRYFTCLPHFLKPQMWFLEVIVETTILSGWPSCTCPEPPTLFFLLGVESKQWKVTFPRYSSLASCGTTI